MSAYEILENLSSFRAALIKQLLDAVYMAPDSVGIDVGCGIGGITELIYEYKNLQNNLLGLDHSEELIRYARERRQHNGIQFIQGDVTKIKPQFLPNTFDWIWSMDTLWAGPPEYGCPADNPDDILKQLYSLLKENGKIYLSFWTSQKLLPGYPMLEARLNATVAANRPYADGMSPYKHVLCAKKWLQKAGFRDIEVNTFVGNISGPLNTREKTSVAALYEMFWAGSEDQFSPYDWEKFKELCLLLSDHCLLHDPDYYGFYTYTLIQGTKHPSAV